LKLILFFSRGVSLKEWLDTGLLDREKALYERHLQDGVLTHVCWLTYGAGDAKLAHTLRHEGRLHPGIEVVAPPLWLTNRKWGIWAYSLLMPLLHRKSISNAGILRTNQMDGSWSAILCRACFGLPLILRTGYTMSRFELLKANPSRWRLAFWTQIERFAYRHCDVALVSSSHDKTYVEQRYGVDSRHIHLLRNYIDTSLFKPMMSTDRHLRRLIFVGRLSKQKNVENLIRATAQLGIGLDLYGDGELKQALSMLASQVKADVCFKGPVPNAALPAILSGYRYFVLPSLYEGMPKTLLEAMACGLICVGTDVEGINEVISHGTNGFLANGTDEHALVTSLQKAMSFDQPEKISVEAVKTIRTTYSLDAICDIHRSLLPCQ
jgi:glycosyltransferase involved in cell wall biosynthesis